MTARDDAFLHDLGVDDFPPTTVDAWREAAEKSLKGRPLDKLTTKLLEGVEIAPLLTAADVDGDGGLPGQPPFTRGRTALIPAHGWHACQLFDQPDPSHTATSMALALDRGVGAVQVRLAAACRAGFDADEPEAHGHDLDGVVASSTGDLDVLFGQVPVSRTPVILEGGGAAVPALALYAAAARRHGLDTNRLRGGVDIDPLGALAGDGHLPLGLDRSFHLVADTVAWASQCAPALRVLTVSTVPYHRAGSTAVQDLGFALATGLESLRAAEAGGVGPDLACRHLRFVVAMGRDVFLGVATLRALRRLWSRVAGACGVDNEAAAPFIHAMTSPRTLTRRDPWVNLLRGTHQTFAAIIGGADAITTLEFDRADGPPAELGRRMAINTHTILREESHLGRVTDPAGGSYFLEKLTDDLCHRAWELFQDLEREGGMRHALDGGLVSRLVSETLASRRKATAHRKEPVTGVSTWPNLAEKPIDHDTFDEGAILSAATARVVEWREGHDTKAELTRLADAVASGSRDGSIMTAAVDAAAAGATLGQLTRALRTGARPNRIVPLPTESEAYGFEALRDAADGRLEATGVRPRIFLANLGPIADHNARATFARSFFEAGGVEALGNDGFADSQDLAEAFSASGAAAAVICSSDTHYAAAAEESARALKAAGARAVFLAGRPGEHETPWREAGVDHFIFVGCDVLATLTALHRELGVSS